MTPEQIDIINCKLLGLWRSPQAGAQPLYPMLHKPWPPGGLITVGINPAFQTQSEEGEEPRARFSFLKGEVGLVHIMNDPDLFYKWDPVGDNEDFNIELSHRVEKLAREKYKRFFGPCWKVRDRLGFSGAWHHLDILSVRRTDQSSLSCSIGPGDSLKDFGKAQLEIFDNLLSLGNPEIIVFTNVTAARIYKKSRRLVKNEAFECYMDYRNSRTVPVLVSGPRLDNYSIDRLAWHASQVLDALRAGTIKYPN